MEDRVADILAERAAMESGAAAAVILSLVAHAGLSALGVWAAWHHTAAQMPAVMNIQFAKPAVPIAAPDVVEAPRIEHSKAVIAPPAPVATKPATKPVARPVAASPFGKSPKAATEVPPAIAAPAPVAETQPDVRTEGGDFPYTVYIDRMKTLIGSRWFRPQSASGIAATLYFVIDRDGTLRDAKVETSSGNSTFDRGALRAILESSPLPPLPFGYSGTYLGVHLTFR